MLQQDSEDAKNTVVLKVNGNLIINEGVTLTACKSDDGYGGPKGLMIYCTGTITNNGTISMTARGARAEGENVYLYENNNNTFEYIPAQGAKGGESLRKGRNSGGNGINGYAGSKRQTGGGGSGAVWASDDNPIAISGAGGTGTSYSGGAGGGGCNQNSGLTIQAEDGSSTGGKGGNGRGYRASSSWATRLAGERKTSRTIKLRNGLIIYIRRCNTICFSRPNTCNTSMCCWLSSFRSIINGL